MNEGTFSVEWTQKLFVEHADLFLRIFKLRQQGTLGEVEGLANIFAEYRVPKRGRVLDLACGIGRHAVPLAKRGYRVVGLDLSPPFVRRAKAYARSQKVESRTEFYVGDTRLVQDALKDVRPFDAMISLWASIGYYGEEEDFRIFRALKMLAARRCLLVVDTAHRDQQVRLPANIMTDLGGIEHHERRKLNLESSEVENQWSFYEKRSGNLMLKARVDFSLRVYALHELKGLLERAGWSYAKCYGGFELKPFTPESRRMIICCKA